MWGKVERESLDRRFDAVRDLINAEAQRVEIALAAADKAVTKAETAAEKRLDGVNEFRKTLADQTATFVPRAEIDLMYKQARERVDQVADQLGARIDAMAAEQRRVVDEAKAASNRLLLTVMGTFLAASASGLIYLITR